jgi:hypothetical protein
LRKKEREKQSKLQWLHRLEHEGLKRDQQNRSRERKLKSNKKSFWSFKEAAQPQLQRHITFFGIGIGMLKFYHPQREREREEGVQVQVQWAESLCKVLSPSKIGRRSKA